MLSLLCGQPCAGSQQKTFQRSPTGQGSFPAAALSHSPSPDTCEMRQCVESHLWGHKNHKNIKKFAYNWDTCQREKILFGWYFLTPGSPWSFAILLICSLWCRLCRAITERGNQEAFRSLLSPVFLCFQRSLAAFLHLHFANLSLHYQKIFTSSGSSSQSLPEMDAKKEIKDIYILIFPQDLFPVF